VIVVLVNGIALVRLTHIANWFLYTFEPNPGPVVSFSTNSLMFCVVTLWTAGTVYVGSVGSLLRQEHAVVGDMLILPLD